MQQYTLNITNREGTGRGVARRLRASGKIPASFTVRAMLARSPSLRLIFAI
jgi:hypothetical protein